MPAFIPWLMAAIFGGLRFVAGSIATQVLIGLGIGVITYTGMDISLAYLKSQALSNFGGLSAELVNLLGFMKVGNAISVITSAYTARLSMTAVRNAAGALAFKRFFKL
ncbi:Uncharacterised protein [Xylophilus ampelinus]|nr:Uncharacterised protein [Xylophilus ampelinus]